MPHLVFTCHDPQSNESIEDTNPGSPGVLAGDVHDVASHGQQEDIPSSGQVLETLKQEKLDLKNVYRSRSQEGHLELNKPDGIDEKDKILHKDAQESEDDERLPPVGV